METTNETPPHDDLDALVRAAVEHAVAQERARAEVRVGLARAAAARMQDPSDVERFVDVDDLVARGADAAAAEREVDGLLRTRPYLARRTLGNADLGARRSATLSEDPWTTDNPLVILHDYQRRQERRAAER